MSQFFKGLGRLIEGGFETVGRVVDGAVRTADHAVSKTAESLDNLARGDLDKALDSAGEAVSGTVGKTSDTAASAVKGTCDGVIHSYETVRGARSDIRDVCGAVGEGIGGETGRKVGDVTGICLGIAAIPAGAGLLDDVQDVVDGVEGVASAGDAGSIPSTPDGSPLRHPSGFQRFERA